MIYKCIRKFSRGYTTYEEGSLWARILSDNIILMNMTTGVWIECSKTEFNTNFIECNEIIGL